MSKSKQSERVLNLPAGYFGMVLGIIGMGFAWRYASQVWPVSHWIGDGLVILAMVIWGLLTLAFISRLLRFPHSVLAEIRHPVMSSFVSLFPATTMLVAIGFVPWFRPLSLLLFSLGGIMKGQFDLFYQVIGNNGVLYDVTDIMDTFVYRSLKQDFDIGMSTAAGLYQSVFGFIVIMVTNTLIKRGHPEQALF